MTKYRIDKTEPNRVPAEGPIPAKIMLIGEAPGDTEVKQGKPFVGLSGSCLNDILAEVGIDRAECYVTNVVKYRPVNNKFANFYEKVGTKKVESTLLSEGKAELLNEIAQVQPNVIVPLGNEALETITGLRGILNYRGSVLTSTYGKVIPTIHPASVIRDWSQRPAVVSDFEKVKSNMDFPEIRTEERELIVTYTAKEALNELGRIKLAKDVAFDIETESGQITCIGFAYSSKRAVCIPFWCGTSGSLHGREDEQRIWEGIRNVLEDEGITKIGHNGSYDIGYLRRTVGINVRGYGFDTMCAMHTLYLELPKSLAFATSIYTDQPYYKFMRKADSMDGLFRYNATDACVTYEIYTKLKQELLDNDLWTFYCDYVHSLIEPLTAMEVRGVRFDVARRNELRREYRNKIKMLTDSLQRQVGHELNPNSHPQMTKWLYKELGYPKVMKLNKETGTYGLTADNDALVKCMAYKACEALTTVLSIRELGKIYSTYLDVKLDEDKRIRCSYNITGTETGRLSSSATAEGTGTNLQNIPKGVVKSLFIPDEGYVFVEADLSQAEARVVAYLSNEVRLIKVFEEGGDIHRKNAANIFGKPESEVTGDERQMAKRVVHASNYGMGPGTFSAQTGLPLSRARDLLNQYFTIYPRIKLWHLQIQDVLKRTRSLTTPFGRKRIFFNRWSDSLLKEGLAYIPQSTVADILNQGMLALHKEWLGKEDRMLLLQVHDSVLVQCKKEVVDGVINELYKFLTRPVRVNGGTLTIPVDVKQGASWGELC